MKKLKYFGNYIILTYIISLSFATIWNEINPSQTTAFVYFFLPLDNGFTENSFVRYRMLLWITSTIVFLFLTIIIGYFGILGTDMDKFKLMPWWNPLFYIILIATGWIFYPIIFLCTDCVTSNDLVYFILTVLLFLAMQIFAQAVILKTQILLGLK